jgi:WD40 repeat protein
LPKLKTNNKPLQEIELADFLPPQRAVITPDNAGQLALLAELPHQWGANGVAFSPDGSLLATAQATLQLWRMVDGEREFVLQAGDGVIQDVAFKPDGSLVATAAGDHTVRLWDAELGIPVMLLRSHRTLMCSVAFSPDGSRLAAGSGNFSDEAAADNVVHVWNADWQETVLDEPRDQVCVAFSPDGLLVAAGEEDGGIWLWDAETLDCVRCLEPPDGNQGVWRLAFSPDGSLLAAGGHSALSSRGGAIFLWDVARGQLLDVLPDDSEDVWGIAYSPAGDLIVSGGLEAVNSPSAVRVWSAHHGELLAVLDGHRQPIECIAFSSDQTLIASGGGDGVLLWGIRE